MTQRDAIWKNRIIGQGEKPASQFLANDKNWRLHPQAQREALHGALNEVGWVAPVIENRRTGMLVDGHERVWQALQNGDATVPFVEVDLDEAEEAYVLATLDPIGAMAAADAQQLQALIADVQTSAPSIQEMLDELLGLEGRAAADAADRETLLDQAVQLRPAREYIVVMCEGEGEWAQLVSAFDLKAARRGGYKRGSPYDDIGTNRVIYASELLSRLNADSDTE